jgi:hypothetical protein
MQAAVEHPDARRPGAVNYFLISTTVFLIITKKPQRVQ